MNEIRIEQPLLEETNRAAQEARDRYTRDGLFVVNMMSSPGAGKTSLLEQTLEHSTEGLRIGVIEGDIQGSADADRLARFGIPVVQINTDGSCHLDPRQVTQALDEMGDVELDVLIIENVGNLVCPAEFDLGEHVRVMLLSVTEGHDKPGKYPLMFRTSDLLLINKMDLLAATNFDVEEAIRVSRSLNPALDVLRICCTTGEGLDDWNRWLARRARLNRSEGAAPR